MTSWDVASIGAGVGGRRSEVPQEVKDDRSSIKSVCYVDGENSPTPESSYVQSLEQSEDATRATTPKNTGMSLPVFGPGLIAAVKETQKNSAIPAPTTCPRCGVKIDAADTKIIPKQKVWFIFLALFFCCCWWISWLPFLFNSLSKPVEICPYCYRRTDRPNIESDNLSP